MPEGKKTAKTIKEYGGQPYTSKCLYPTLCPAGRKRWLQIRTERLFITAEIPGSQEQNSKEFFFYHLMMDFRYPSLFEWRLLSPFSRSMTGVATKAPGPPSRQRPVGSFGIGPVRMVSERRRRPRILSRTLPISRRRSTSMPVSIPISSIITTMSSVATRPTMFGSA